MKFTESEYNKKQLCIETKDEAKKFIGKRCAKFSGKPFKSGNKINTITGVGTIVTKDGKSKVAFYFDEDNTLVSCQMVYIIE